MTSGVADEARPTRRAAIVGYGDVSTVHAEAIEAIDGIDLVAVCDVDEGRRSAASSERGVPAYDDLGELIERERPDVIHVTTPHDQHVDATLTALAAGVHVIQEKPIAHTVAEGERLVAATRTSGPKVGICFQNRYNVSSQEAKRILDSGALGAIHGVYASVVWTRTAAYYEAKPWRGVWARAGGGLLINQAIHTLDLVQWLLGGFESAVGLVSTRKFPGVIEVEDTADALFTHPGGVRTTFFGSLTAPIHRPVEIEIYADNGTLTIRNGVTVTWADGRIEQYAERAATSAGRAYWGVSHEILLRDFYARLDDPEPFWIGPAEAMPSMHMLTSLYDQTPLT